MRIILGLSVGLAPLLLAVLAWRRLPVTREIPFVFCAVMAVVALVPCRPRAVNVLRSA